MDPSRNPFAAEEEGESVTQEKTPFAEGDNDLTNSNENDDGNM